MLGSAALEVLIGLVVIYLLLSLIASAVNEGIASHFGRRGACLRQAIGRLLAGDVVTGRNARASAVVNAFYQTPQIQALKKSDKRDPSYIPDETFADAVLGLLAPPHAATSVDSRLRAIADAVGEHATAPPKDGRIVPTGRLYASLQPLFNAAMVNADRQRICTDLGRLEAFKTELVQWFGRTMDRTTGWYKRYTQLWITAIAAFVVIAINADTIAIVSHLSSNPEARGALVTAAESIKESDLEDPQGREALEKIHQLANEASIPLGWTVLPWAKGGMTWSHGAGLLLSIFAVSLGAPFWFQMLQKLVSLRGAGTVQAAPPPGAAPPSAAAAPSDGEDPDGPTPPTGGAPAVPAAPPKASGGLDDRYWENAAGRPIEDPGSTVTALTMARLSALAYKDEGTARAVLERLDGKANPSVFFDSHGTQGFVYSLSKQDMAIVFRGTEASSLEDWITDARISLRPAAHYGGTRVHMGFDGALEAVWPDLGDAMKSKAFKGAKRVFCTGHSLGAALATLTFARLAGARGESQTEPYLYTFGSPRVGDDDFAKHLVPHVGKGDAPRALRFVNNQDLVTRVAPRAFGYGHVGLVRYFDARGNLSADVKDWFRFLSLVVNALDDFKIAARGTIADHAIGLYVGRLEGWAGRGDAG